MGKITQIHFTHTLSYVCMCGCGTHTLAIGFVRYEVSAVDTSQLLVAFIGSPLDSSVWNLNNAVKIQLMIFVSNEAETPFKLAISLLWICNSIRKSSYNEAFECGTLQLDKRVSIVLCKLCSYDFKKCLFHKYGCLAFFWFSGDWVYYLKLFGKGKLRNLVLC